MKYWIIGIMTCLVVVVMLYRWIRIRLESNPTHTALTSSGVKLKPNVVVLLPPDFVGGLELTSATVRLLNHRRTLVKLERKFSIKSLIFSAKAPSSMFQTMKYDRGTTYIVFVHEDLDLQCANDPRIDLVVPCRFTKAESFARYVVKKLNQLKIS